MLFYQYIRTLYEHIPFCKTQHEFTEEFLCHAFNLDSRKAPSISSCKRYFAGDKQEKEGEEIRIDTIGPFAKKHIKTLDCNELDKYLSNIIHKSKAESELRAAFQNDYAQLPPDVDNNGTDEQIKDDNGVYISKDVIQLAKQTRRLFVVVINEAICSYSRKKNGYASSSQKEPVPSQDESAQPQDKPFVSESDLGRIRQIIRELCVLLEAMYELWPIFNSEQFMEQLKDPSSTEPKVCEFNDMFKQFSKLDKEMLFFCRKYKHIKQFEPVKLLANTLNKYCFKSGFTRGVDSNGSLGIFVYQNPGLQEYSDALVELDRSLDNLS